MADDKDKPHYDEQTLAKLLEAAYVLQEHNRELRHREVNLEIQRDQLGAQERAASARTAGTAGNSAAHAAAPATTADYTQTLAQIVETQRQIQARSLQLQAAIDLVADRVVEISHAGGAAIGILADKNVRYQAASGTMTLPVGSEVVMEKALCVASLRTGQVIRCTDVNAEFLLDVEECQRRGILSMIGVPVYHDGGIAGGLEVYYGSAQAFTEQDVHTCQLMAGLVTEALVREDELASQRSLAEQRAAMREALEKVKPAVAAMADRANKGAAASSSPVFMCRKCGHPLVGEEQFCGNCGTPRSGDYGAASLQSKVASLWQMQEAQKKAPADSADTSTKGASVPALLESAGPVLDGPVTALPQEISPADETENEAEAIPLRVPITIPDDPVPILPAPMDSAIELDARHSEKLARPNDEEETSLAATDHPWTSAAAARNYLEQIAGLKRGGGLARFWNERRGDIYLAAAVIVVAIVIRWGVWSSHSVSAGNPAAGTAHHKVDPNADLSWFDRMLISLGLAEAPAPTESKGNPDTQVWVDLHTALYYCPGTDLYGKTPKGKYTSQRDAQLDSFGPASGRPCD